MAGGEAQRVCAAGLQRMTRGFQMFTGGLIVDYVIKISRTSKIKKIFSAHNDQGTGSIIYIKHEQDEE